MLGPFFLPTPTCTLTKRRLYCSLFFARPVCFLALSVFFATLGVCPRTLPARASEPWTLPCEHRRDEGGQRVRGRKEQKYVQLSGSGSGFQQGSQSKVGGLRAACPYRARHQLHAAATNPGRGTGPARGWGRQRELGKA